MDMEAFDIVSYCCGITCIYGVESGFVFEECAEMFPGTPRPRSRCCEMFPDGLLRFPSARGGSTLAR